ncbi:MAG: shikimate kinase [Chitinophagaceae bacterium]|nr:shikimate kinase [Chitinophagaceae bacterium]
MKFFLIGFMGAGKSFWGRQWAMHLNYSFIDLDKAIEEKIGKPVASIFEENGEIFFRKREAEILREILKADNVIIACGGGTPCYENNMNWMNENGHTVYLSRSPVELYKNVLKEKWQRPLLKNITDEEILSYIEKKLIERLPFYEKAAVIFTSEQVNVNSLDKIIR